MTIENGVEEIEEWAFAYCYDLRTVSIPASVSTLGNFLFEADKSLETISVSSDSSYFLSQSGVLFDKDRTTLLCYPAGKSAESYSVPSGVKTIGVNAFSASVSLKSLTLPDSVKTLADWAVADCYSLTDVSLPDGLTAIGMGAFAGDSDLKSIFIPESVTFIGNAAFNNCSSLTEIHFGGTGTQWHSAVDSSQNVVPSGCAVYFDSTGTQLTDISNFSYAYISNQIYTGQPITPEFILYGKDGGRLVKNKDYSVAYSNNTEPGTATVTVTEGEGTSALIKKYLEENNIDPVFPIEEIRDTGGKKFLYVKISDEVRGVVTITKDIKIKTKGNQEEEANAAHVAVFSDIFFFGILGMALIILLLVIRYFFIS